ncbi:glycosyltransferase family 4 protein [Marinomonas sp. 2405UD66-6]|uniref:glycosyltransferase family 4 protein n=1 Tax=Marinomonas sp. 2405UD66-6 TaxID=3391834 RepID=UPI0039C8E797
MNVLHFYKTYFPDTFGGIEQVISQLANSTEALGVHSTVLSLTPNKQVESPIKVGNQTVYRSHSAFELASTPFSFKVFKQFKDLVDRADVIHYHFPYPLADVLHFMYARNKPCVVSYHSDVVKQKTLLKLYNPLQNQFLRSVDRIVVASPNYLNSSDVLPPYRDKISIIPYSLEPTSYASPSQERLDHWRDILEEKFFLFVGVARYYKGLHVLIEAASQLSYPVVILGSGPLEDALKQQAKDAGADNVIFLGALDDEDKTALLNLCYAFVFPSHMRSEAFGISLLEASMNGKPMISCEIETGTSYINIDQETGLVIPPNNALALQEAMQTLWQDEALASQFGEQAKARFYELFSRNKMAAGYYDLYQEVCKEKGVFNTSSTELNN